MPKMNTKFQTIKLETCKPNHPAPDNFYKLIPTAQNSEVI